MAQTREIQLLSWGEDSGRGNLLGIQPWMTPVDYATENSIYTKLGGYLSVARREGWLNRSSVVVWPEYIGTWLITLGESSGVHRASSLGRAMRRIAARHPFRFVGALFASPERDKSTAALLRTQAEVLSRRYQTLFADLAADYGVTMVAGSVVLPDPRVVKGDLMVGRWPLCNVAAVFRPDGSLYTKLVRKVYPVEAERRFTTPASLADLPVLATHAGRLGVLICADAWYPTSYERLRSQNVEMIAVPAHATEPGGWTKPWGGYNGFPAPDDVAPEDVGRLTEAEAWRTYALAGRIAHSGATVGITVFMVGELWDLGAEGASEIVIPGAPAITAQPGTPALLNYWF